SFVQIKSEIDCLLSQSLRKESKSNDQQMTLILLTGNKVTRFAPIGSINLGSGSTESQSDPSTAKASLTSWWVREKERSPEKEEEKGPKKDRFRIYEEFGGERADRLLVAWL
ncbi:hypothetical protein TYRP_019279, partial [Tyrophagus putrescentiae]